jgi:hypothetical protein
VSFRWKDYRHASRQKLMHLDAPEFIRRFLLHVLPNGHRQRTFGANVPNASWPDGLLKQTEAAKKAAKRTGSAFSEGLIFVNRKVY